MPSRQPFLIMNPTLPPPSPTPSADPTTRPSPRHPPLPADIADSIAQALQGLEFGSVELTVHNSRVVQIERHERIRLAPSPGPRHSAG